MKKIFIVLAACIVPIGVFAQNGIPPLGYIQVGEGAPLPISIMPNLDLVEKVGTAPDGAPIYALKKMPMPPVAPPAMPAPTKPSADPATPILPPVEPKKPPVTPLQPTPTTTPKPPRIDIIDSQKELDKMNDLLRKIEAEKVAGNVIKAIPAARGSTVSLFGLPKTNDRIYIPVHIRNMDIPSVRPTVDGSYFNLFTGIGSNIPVDTPPENSGGFGTPPNTQPPDFNFGIPPVPVHYWGLPNPKTLFPRITPTGLVFVINLNPYQVVGKEMGGVLKTHYRLGMEGSEMVVEYVGPDKDGKYTTHYYTLDPSKPNGIGTVFNNEAEFIAYGQSKGYWQPSRTIFGTPTMVINANGAWRGGQYYATAAKIEPVLDKDGNIIQYILKDALGATIGTTGIMGTATITKNPGKEYQMYWDPVKKVYEIKVIEPLPPLKK